MRAIFDVQHAAVRKDSLLLPRVRSYKKLPEDVKPGSQILCADGSIVLEVISTNPKAGTVRAKCQNNATLGCASLTCIVKQLMQSCAEQSSTNGCAAFHLSMLGTGVCMREGSPTSTGAEAGPGMGRNGVSGWQTGLLLPPRERKNVNLPGVVVDLPTLTAKDETDLVQWGLPNDIDFIAASFVRKGSDLDYIRKVAPLFAAFQPPCTPACWVWSL